MSPTLFLEYLILFIVFFIFIFLSKHARNIQRLVEETHIKKTIQYNSLISQECNNKTGNCFLNHGSFITHNAT